MESGTVFNYLSVDFMQSVIPTVDYLLKNNVNVIVISGNLDLIWYYFVMPLNFVRSSQFY